MTDVEILPEGMSAWDATCEPAYTAGDVEALVEVGPGTVARDRGEPVWVPDLLAEERWQAWRKVALLLGWRSALAVPVTLEEGSGAVVVYCCEGTTLDLLRLLDRVVSLGAPDGLPEGPGQGR